MEVLLSYIERNAAEIAADLLPSLQSSDSALKALDPALVTRALAGTALQMARFARSRDPSHLAALDRELATAGDLGSPSIVRILFGIEDLAAIRGGSGYRDLEDLIDDLRALRATVREALCALMARAPAAPPVRATRPRTIESPVVQELLRPARLIGRADELRQLWGRLRALSAHPDSVHQVVGIKAPDGFGKTTLVRTFLERVQQRLGHPPTVVSFRAARLFELPDWPFASLLRSALNAPLGVPGNAARIAQTLGELSEATGVDLDDAQSYVMRFIGEETNADTASRLSARRIGIGMRDAAAAVVEALARRAVEASGAPLFVVLEDASELDSPTWARLGQLLRRVPATAPLLVLLTYDMHFVVPNEVNRFGDFSEIQLKPLDMSECEALIDATLEPNTLDEQTRLRLAVGAQGSPLLLIEAIRYLSLIGVLARGTEGWTERRALPEGALSELAVIVRARRRGLSPQASDLLEMLAVVEDTLGGRVLQEVAARRGITFEELNDGLEQLESSGLVRTRRDEFGVVAQVRHPLIRDEIYRQMSLDRRRGLHEDAGEVFSRLPGTAAFPSVAARHLALAGLPARGLEGLLSGIERCLRINALDTALELCRQAVSVLNNVDTSVLNQYLYAIVRRRERVYARLGATPLQRVDLREATHLAQSVGTDTERHQISLRVAGVALQRGDTSEAMERSEAVAVAVADNSPERARARMLQAIAAWQVGRVEQADALITELGELPSSWPVALRARVLHVRGMTAAGRHRGAEAIHHFFEAWRLHRLRGDTHDEALTIDALADVFLSFGRVLDAERLLRRAERLVEDAGVPRLRARLMLRMAVLHADFGDFDEAEALFSDALRLVDKSADRLLHAVATIGRGQILINRGQFDDAMPLLAQCLKDLGRDVDGEAIYVNALVALATNFALFARGDKLVLGGLRYAREAADKAAAIGHWPGRIRALVVQVRGLLVLRRVDDADKALSTVDQVMTAALRVDPHLERLRIGVEYCRHLVCVAQGAPLEAKRALDAAWLELQSQLGCLDGSGYERGFLNNLHLHRELKQAMDARG